MHDSFPIANETDIAIIGMTCRFPGANDIETFWQNLRHGVESVTFFSDEELLETGIDPELINNPNYVKAKAILEHIDGFDAHYFGYSAHEAETLDPQHRFFLECAVAALENAGYFSENNKDLISVYAGTGLNSYLLNNLCTDPTMSNFAEAFQNIISTEKDFVTTRVAYKLNLKGPAVTVQTACSTSLVAVHMACQSLLNGESDIALAGGVSIRVPHKSGYLYQEGMIASPDGHCRTFDEKSQGIVSGDGVGIVVLKRLEDALKEGDTIHAVIKSSVINNDGAQKIGYTAPSVDGQAAVITEAHAIARINADSISYIEAHGTGTTLGDPIEISALTQAFRETTAQTGYCAIGSVKTNFGHLDAAAGVAGLIKTVLALKNKEIPPSLHFEKPNPKIDFANSPFYVNSKLTTWDTDSLPRRAGVSSFGIGGTNAHVILEESPTENISKSELEKDNNEWQLLLLSAKTDTALETVTHQLLAHIKQNPTINFDDMAYTLAIGRYRLEHRRAIIVNNETDFDNLQHLSKNTFTGIHKNKTAPVIFMFSGQGTQYVNMARELYEKEAVFKNEVDRCIKLLKSHLLLDLSQILFSQTEKVDEITTKLKQTAMTQPALFTIEYALAKLWMHWGIKPHAMIGHSIGEYVAACLAGVLSLEDALAIVALRGQMMQTLPTGAMLAVPLSAEKVTPLLNKKLSIAAVNMYDTCIVSGFSEAIYLLESTLIRQNVECQRLHTSHAFHSPMMEPIKLVFAQRLSKFTFNPPKIPYISNVTGTWITPEQAIAPDYYAQHLRQTVLFADGLQELFKYPDAVFLEVGPGRTLTTFAARHPKKVADQTIVSSIRHPKDNISDIAFLLTAIGKLWIAGVNIDWETFYVEEELHRIPLPTYPFEHQSYWANYKKQADKQPDLKRKADIADWFYVPSWKRMANQPTIPLSNHFLIFADQYGLGKQLGEYLSAQNKQVTYITLGKEFTQVNENTYTLNPSQENDYQTLVQKLAEKGDFPQTIIHGWNITEQSYLNLEDIDQSQDLGLYSLLNLTQALGKQSINDTLNIVAISNNMQEVLGGELYYPEKSTIFGAIKVIPLEYENIQCRNVDIVFPQSEQEQKQVIQQLVTELQIENNEPNIAYRGQHRWIETYEPLHLSDNEPVTQRLRKNGVYLITGGFGGMGLTFAEYLAQTVQAKLVLVARSQFPEKSTWQDWLAHNEENDETSKKIRQLQTLEQLGSEILIARADISDLQQMQSVIEQIKTQFGTLHGVIHTAGLADYEGIIHKRNRAMTDKILAPKVKGTLVLNEVTQEFSLDLFVLCSTLGSVLYHTKFGQVGYAAANEFLDTYCYYKTTQTSTYTITINWTDWEKVGMSVKSRELNKTLGLSDIGDSLIIDSLYPQEGATVFAKVIQNTLPRIATCTQNLDNMIEQEADLIARIVTGENELATTNEEEHKNVTKYPRPNSLPEYTAPSNDIEQQIADVWQEFLGIEKIGVHDDYFELGGDSLLAVQLVAKLNKLFDVKLAPHKLIESPTITGIAKLLNPITKQKQPSLPECLVQLQQGKSSYPLFFIHPIGGHVFYYRDLVQHLDTELTVYGIQAKGLHSDNEPLTTIPEIANYYVKLVKHVQPSGPYFLIGASFGGIVAYEMAQQLQTDNQEIALLAMMDSPNKENLRKKFDQNWEMLAFLLGRGTNTTYWKAQFEKLNPDQHIDFFLRKGKEEGILMTDFQRDDLDRLMNRMATYFNAMETYDAKNYEGNLIFFYAQERDIVNITDPTEYWKSLVQGETKVHGISGNHFTMNYPPHVNETASLLMYYIKQST